MKTFNTTNLAKLCETSNGQVLALYNQLSSSLPPISTHTHTHRVPAVNVLPESNLKKNGNKIQSVPSKDLFRLYSPFYFLLFIYFLL